MQNIYLPLSTAAKHIIERKIALGLVELPAIPGTTHTKHIGTPVHTDPAPAQQVPVILALYYAHAYPSHYYQNPVQVDVKVILYI